MRVAGSIGDDIVAAGIGAQVVSPDTADAFRFFFTGGAFSMFFTFDGEGDVTRELYREGSINWPLTHAGDNWGILDPGNYIFELTYFGEDPPFQAALFEIPGPGGELPQILAPRQAAPEPGALALVLTGLLAIAAALRRRIPIRKA